MNRFLPAVLAAYGTPLKTLMPAASTPRILPAVVSAVTKLSAAHEYLTPAADEATSREACLKKSRRDCCIAILVDE
jgi:hypothetical protein